jgi:hypothetical protein
MDMFPRSEIQQRHSAYPVEPCGDGGIDVKVKEIKARKWRISGLFAR